MGKYRVVIDARMYGLEHAGIGRYVMNLLRNFQFSNSNFQFILLVKRERLEKIKNELGPNFEYFPVRSRHYSLAEQVELPLVLKKINPDLVHFPHFNIPVLWPKKFVVTIHDLIKHYFRGKETTTKASWCYWPKYWSYRLLVNLALKRATVIFTPSHYWRKKLITDFGVNEEKIIVTYEAVDPLFLNLAKNQLPETREKFHLRGPFLIYTGSVYPHKNITRLLLALKMVPKVKLVIACSRSVFTERLGKLVDHLGLGPRVIFLGFIQDQDLVGLYQQTIALVQPSLMEGFGLTGLEAMAVGCPVLAARASCLPEIYASAALYFDPLNPNDLAEKIRMVLADQRLRKNLINQGRLQVKKYSWQKTAQETLAGYLTALKSFW